MAEKKSCFIIMPFTKAVIGENDLDTKSLKYIYEHVIKKAVSEYQVDDKIVYSQI